VQARVELLGDRPQIGVARCPQPQFDPQHPVLGQARCGGQAAVDHRLQALAVRGRRQLALTGDPRLPGLLVGVVERFREQSVTGLEVVVDKCARDPRLHRDPGDPHAVDALAGDLAHGRG